MNTVKPNLTLTTDNQVKFMNWWRIINGVGTVDTKSNMQKIEDFAISIISDVDTLTQMVGEANSLLEKRLNGEI